MSFSPKFKIGDIVSIDDVKAEFQVGNCGSIRKSTENNCLVLISNHTSKTKEYNDNWQGDTFYYEGMNIKDKKLSGQNKALADGNLPAYLFEVYKNKEYTYQGQVKLAGNYELKEISCKDGTKKDIIIFPLHKA